MAKFGCPPRFIAMLRQFHDDMQAKNREENARAVHTDDEAIARTAKDSVLFPDFLEMSGSEMNSELTLNLKSTMLWYCQPSFMHVRHGQCISVMPRD